jgi:hypothetical protein
MKKPAVLILASLFSLLFVNCKKENNEEKKHQRRLNQKLF